MFMRSGCFTGRHSGVVLYGADAAVEIEDLAQGDVEERMPPPTGVVSGPLMATAKFADAADGVVRRASSGILLSLLAGEDFVPGNGALAVICFSTAASNTRTEAFRYRGRCRRLQ